MASALAVFDCGDLELATHYGVVELDEDERVVGFEEKPSEPARTLVATATYLYHREHVPLVGRYLEEGNSPDQPGRLVAWLTSASRSTATPSPAMVRHRRPDQLLEADNSWRVRVGLPPRTEYSTIG